MKPGEKLKRPEKSSLEKSKCFDGENKTKLTHELFARVDLKLY